MKMILDGNDSPPLAVFGFISSFFLEIVQHEERGIRAIIFIDNLSQIAIGGYRGDGTGM